jgi:chorismate mutase
MAVMGYNSEYWRYVNELIAQGMDETEARNRATVKFFIENPVLASVGGFISGGVFSAVGAIMGGVNITTQETSTTAPDTKMADITQESIQEERAAQEPVQAPQTATEPEPSIVPETSTTQPTRPVTPHAARYASGEVLTFRQGKGDVQVRTVSETARAAFTDLEQKTMRELERVGKTLGVTVQWAFDIQHYENGAWAQDNGMYDPESNTLYISWESATADGGAPYAAVLGHEIAHSLENTQAYNTIMKYAVSKAKASGAYNAKMAALRERYGDRSETYLHQELVADTVQEVFTNPAELRRLVNSRRGVVGAILNAIDTILGKFKNGNAEIARLRQMLQDALDERQTARGEVRSSRRTATEQTKTEAFKKWFSNSVVVDENGDPLVVYHGTNAKNDFAEFRPKPKSGNQIAFGIHFTPNAKFASEYAKQNGGRIYPVYLSIQNPLDLTKIYSINSKEYALAKKLVRGAKSTFYVSDGKFYMQGAVDATSGTRAARIIKESGYDGIIYEAELRTPGRMPGTYVKGLSALTYVVFEPSQIKSATANVGTFDADNPDIRFSRRTSNIPGSVLENPNLTEQSADTIKVFTEHGAFDYTQSSNKKDMAAAMDAVQKDGVDIAVGKIREKVDSGKRFNSAEMAYIEAALMAANAQKNTKAVMRILGDLRVIATEMGQNIQILRLLKTLAPADRHSTVQRMVDLVQHNVDLHFNKKNRKGQKVIVQADPALMQNLLEAATTKEADIVERLIREDLNRQIPATLMDKLNAWRYLSMLGNVKTHVRNIFGNATMYLLALNKDLYGAVMETLATATGAKIERTKSLHNPVSKLARDARAFAVKDADQMKAFLQGGGKETNISMDRTIFETRWLEWARKHAMEFLEIEDWWFLSANYRKALTGYMIANRLTPGQMTGKVLDKARLVAIREAQRNTFRDASDAANALNKFVRNHPVGGILVEGLMPFKRTPINILKRGAEYSPLGLIRAVYRVSKGQITAAEFIDGVAASLAGSGMLILGMWLKSLGLIRASGEDKDREEYFERLKGHQAYALEIGDYSLTLDWLNPVNIPLFMGAELMSMLEGNATDINYSAIVNMLATVADPMTQMSMLQGINNALGSFKTDDKAGAIGNLITSSVYSYLGQYVPTLFGQLSRTLDDVRRDTYAASDSAWTREGERFARKLMNKVPGMSYMLEPYVDMWGLPEQDGKNWAMRAIENMVLPWWGKQVNNADPVNIELERLYVKTGDIRVLPKYPQNYHSVNGTTYRVKSDEIDDYRKDYGQTAKEALENLIDLRPYNRLPDENKAAVVAQIYSFATAYAKDKSSLPYSVPKDMRKAFSAKRKRIAPEVYFLFRELAGLDGSISQESAKTAIDNLPKLTNTQRAWLWWSANTSWDASKNPYISGYQP